MYSNKVKDFLRDEGFIHYVLEETPKADSSWELHFRDDSRNKKYAEEAKAVLTAPAEVKCPFSETDCQELKERILNTIKGLD